MNKYFNYLFTFGQLGLTLAHEMQFLKPERQKKGGVNMRKIKRIFLMVLGTACLVQMATPAFAKSFSLKDAGISLWIFLVIGAIIILLQLIPAGILFFSLVGSATSLAFGRKKALEERGAEKEKEQIVAGEPLTVRK